MSIVVQKFGGTSVKSHDNMKKACEIVQKYREAGHDLVVVVSAMGREGDPYATDTLINLAKNVSQNINKREMDMLMSCGEVISGNIFTCMLQSIGINSIFLTGRQAGIVTDSNFSDAKIIDVKVDRIKSELNKGKVVVIAGFQGANQNGDITTLGRGGSDTSAVAIGAYLKSDAVEIYTDVDGIMTSDPKIVEKAKILNAIDYDMCLKMAREGAKVIHPKAVEFAIDGNVLLYIKNTFNTESIGTKICSKDYIKMLESKEIKYLKSDTAIVHRKIELKEIGLSSIYESDKKYTKISVINQKYNIDKIVKIQNMLSENGVEIIYMHCIDGESYYVVEDKFTYDSINLIHDFIYI